MVMLTILCLRPSAVRGFVNVFYPCSLEAGKRLNEARRRSTLAGLAVRDGDLVERNLSDKNPTQAFLDHVESCEKCIRAGWQEVYRLHLTTDIVSSLDQSGS